MFPSPPVFHDTRFNTSQQQHQRSNPAQRTALNDRDLQQQALANPALTIMNGLNGAANMAAPVAGYPTPAGHQAELNYIYAMVEDLSRQLAENKRVLEDVVAGVGKVRNRARLQGLGNEELVAGAGEDGQNLEPNLDTVNSLLTEALEKAKFSRDSNAALLSQYATVLQAMLRQLHEYKAKHVADVSAWHRSYRSQLAEARAENSRLREQLWAMSAHAGKANTLLRDFRSAWNDSDDYWRARAEAKAAKQELRFWRRMAMPEVAEDDPAWSDDDDLIDVAEKARLADLKMANEHKELVGLDGGGSSEQLGSDEEGSMSSGSGEGDEEVDAVTGGMERMNFRRGGRGGFGGAQMQRESSRGEGEGTAADEIPNRPASPTT